MTLLFNRSEKKSQRQELRKNQTDAERLLWQKLRSKRFFEIKFFRQYSVGNFILDFYCPQKRLCIEIDGGQHAMSKDYDSARTRYLENLGITVIRFWNNEVMKNIEGVLETIQTRALSLPPPRLGVG